MEGGKDEKHLGGAKWKMQESNAAQKKQRWCGGQERKLEDGSK